jgi:hypothetical protein
MHHPTAQDLQRRKIREWLLALLRFSLTLESGDRAAVTAIADEMDRLGFVAKKPGFSFFLRTSIDVCDAVADLEQAGRKQILREHLARIDDLRLRRAFLAVFDIEAQHVEPTKQDRRATLMRSVQGKMRG